MKDLRKILATACARREEPWALATLVRTAGSTYRKPGAWLLVDQHGEHAGVLSGGCLEDEIAIHGQDVISTGRPRVFSYDTRKLYGCEGHLEVFIEKIPAAEETGNFLTQVEDRLARREHCHTRVVFGTPDGGSELLPPHALVAESDGVFVHSLPLPVRLLILGSGPEVTPMKWFAAGLGWQIEEYHLASEIPESFMPDSQTAVVIMTHQFGRDLTALDRLLPLGLAYIGLLGPRRRHGELIRRFQEYRDLDPDWLNTLHAPAGLDIGSEAPEEIALSIVAEAAATLAGRAGGMLRDRLAPIHAPEMRLQIRGA